MLKLGQTMFTLWFFPSEKIFEKKEIYPMYI
jgi:hypothetical protein